MAWNTSFCVDSRALTGSVPAQVKTHTGNGWMASGIRSKKRHKGTGHKLNPKKIEEGKRWGIEVMDDMKSWVNI